MLTRAGGGDEDRNGIRVKRHVASKILVMLRPKHPPQGSGAIGKCDFVRNLAGSEEK